MTTRPDVPIDLPPSTIIEGPPTPLAVSLPVSGNRRVLAVATADAGGISVRCEDADSDAWHEFRLSRETLTKLLASVPSSPEQLAAMRDNLDAIGDPAGWQEEVNHFPLPDEIARALSGESRTVAEEVELWRDLGGEG